MSLNIAPGRALGQAATISLAVLASVGVALVSLVSGSPAIVVVFSVLFLTIIYLSKVPSVERSLILLVFMVAPIDMGKSIISLSDRAFLADAPGLEISLLDVPMIALAVCWIWRTKVTERAPIVLTGMHKAALLFVLWIWISAYRSASDGTALASALNYSKYIFYFIVISNVVRTPDDWRSVIKGTFLGVAITGVFVLAQVATRSPITLPGIKVPPNSAALMLAMGGGSSIRPVGLFQHPNTLADYMILVLPTALSVLLLGPRLASRKARIGAVTMLGVGAVMLVATLSRGGWICFLLGGVVCLFAYTRAGLIGGKKLVVVGLLSVITLVVVVTSVPSIWDRITGPDSRSNEARRLLTQQSYKMIADNPLIGVGFGVYNRKSQAYTPPGFAYVGADFQKNVRQLVVHNHYLLLAGELGIPALVFFCGMFLYLLMKLFPIRKWTDPGQLSLAIGLSASLAANMLFFSSDNYYIDIRLSMFWLMVGLLQALQLTRVGTLPVPQQPTIFRAEPSEVIEPWVPPVFTGPTALPAYQRSKIIVRAPR